MKIEFKSAVTVTDRRVARAFLELLNTILLAENPADLNLKLLQMPIHPEYGRLMGYFRWNFEGMTFSIDQRTGYHETCYFPGHILTVSFHELLKSNPANNQQMT